MQAALPRYRGKADGYWYDELLNIFIELIENLNLLYMRQSTIIALVSSMSILRYRFSPLPRSGLFFACDSGAACGRSRARSNAQQDAAPRQQAAQRTAKFEAGNQALSRPRMAVSSLRMATRSIGARAAPFAGSGRLSSLLRAPLMVKPCSYSSSRMRRISSTS